MKPINFNKTKIQNTCCRALLFTASIVLICMMVISLLVNSGIADKIAEHSETVYIVNAIWFAVISFVNYKCIKAIRCEETAVTGKSTKKEKVE